MMTMRKKENGKGKRGRGLAAAMAVALMALMLATGAAATTLVHMDLEALTGAASVVARVRVVSSEARWEGGEIYTFTVFEVSEMLKGAAPNLLEVRLIGGRVGSLRSTVDGVPRFRAGEEAFVFLERTRTGALTVTGWVQGTFRIRRDASTGRETVRQDTSAVRVFDPESRQFREGGVRDLSAESFRQRVREAVARQGGRTP